MKKVLTLCIVSKEQKLLLGMKKRGFAAGRWNGFGGKVEEGETLEAASRRELHEEAGITAEVMTKVGVLDFSFKEVDEKLEVHVFHVTEFSGEPAESEEMEPDWFMYSEIPYGQMWSSDKTWLPFVLLDKKFKGSFVFDRPATADYAAEVLSHEIDEVDEL